MDKERFERSPLDPVIDPVRWQRVVASINAAAAPELARRTAAIGTIEVLTHWTRPVLATAAAIVALCSATILATASLAPADESDNPAVAEALVPSSLAAWLAGGEAPTLDDLVTDLQPGEG